MELSIEGDDVVNRDCLVKSCLDRSFNEFLKIINYSCSSYPTRASYSGQVDGFRNPMKNKLKTWLCLKRFHIFLICILMKQEKHST